MGKLDHTRGLWNSPDGEWVVGADGFTVARVGSDPNADRETAETQGNHTLVALAYSVPHDCDHDGCPGRENKRKLEAAAEIVNAARELIAGADREGGSVRSVHRYDVDQLRAAIARWEGR